MPCNGQCHTYTQSVDCTGGSQWSCGCPSGNFFTNNCNWVEEGSSCDFTSCCNYIHYGGEWVVGPCVAGQCMGDCWSCCGSYDLGGGDGDNDINYPSCACYEITNVTVSSGTCNPSNLGDCRFCYGTSGTARCRGMCDDYCGSNCGYEYTSMQCEDQNGDVRGDNGTVYPGRSSYGCATNWCGYHNACSCNCGTNNSITVEQVNGPYIGCTATDACNYDSEALCDDGSCDYSCWGCTDSGATNWDPSASQDDGSCEYYEADCIDPDADNCDPLCGECGQGGAYDCQSAGNCEYPVVGCNDDSAINYDPLVTEQCDGTNGNIFCTTPGPNCCCEYEQEEEKPLGGCMDAGAYNYNPQANYDNGTCIYAEDSYLCEGELSCDTFFQAEGYCPSHLGCTSQLECNNPCPDGSYLSDLWNTSSVGSEYACTIDSDFYRVLEKSWGKSAGDIYGTPQFSYIQKLFQWEDELSGETYSRSSGMLWPCIATQPYDDIILPWYTGGEYPDGYGIGGVFQYIIEDVDDDQWTDWEDVAPEGFPCGIDPNYLDYIPPIPDYVHPYYCGYDFQDVIDSSCTTQGWGTGTGGPVIIDGEILCESVGFFSMCTCRPDDYWDWPNSSEGTPEFVITPSKWIEDTGNQSVNASHKCRLVVPNEHAVDLFTPGPDGMTCWNQIFLDFNAPEAMSDKYTWAQPPRETCCDLNQTECSNCNNDCTWTDGVGCHSEHGESFCFELFDDSCLDLEPFSGEVEHPLMCYDQQGGAQNGNPTSYQTYFCPEMHQDGGPGGYYGDWDMCNNVCPNYGGTSCLHKCEQLGVGSVCAGTENSPQGWCGYSSNWDNLGQLCSSIEWGMGESWYPPIADHHGCDTVYGTDTAGGLLIDHVRAICTDGTHVTMCTNWDNSGHFCDGVPSEVWAFTSGNEACASTNSNQVTNASDGHFWNGLPLVDDYITWRNLNQDGGGSNRTSSRETYGVGYKCRGYEEKNLLLVQDGWSNLLPTNFPNQPNSWPNTAAALYPYSQCGCSSGEASQPINLCVEDMSGDDQGTALPPTYRCNCLSTSHESDHTWEMTGCSGTINCFDYYVDSIQPGANVGTCPYWDDFTCIPYDPSGCMDGEAVNFNELATQDDGSCVYYPEHDTDGNTQTFTCQIWTLDSVTYWCRLPGYSTPNQPWDILLPNGGIVWSAWVGSYAHATIDGTLGYSAIDEIEGVTYSNFFYCNYDSAEGSCSWTDDFVMLQDEVTYGCTNENAWNYDPDAQYNDGSCLYQLQNLGEDMELVMTFGIDNQHGIGFRQEAFNYFITPQFQYSPANPTSNSGNVYQPLEPLFGLSAFYHENEISDVLHSGKEAVGAKLLFKQRFDKTQPGLDMKNLFNNQNTWGTDPPGDDETGSTRNACASLTYLDQINDSGGGVQITEIHATPGRYTQEYIEIYNDSDAAVDISGWKFTRGIGFEFPEGTSIGAYDYIVIARPQMTHCTAETPWTCNVQCLDPIDGEPVEDGEIGECNYWGPDGEEITHPQSGVACSTLDPCYSLDEMLASAPKAHVAIDPSYYGLVAGQTLFEWNLVKSDGRLEHLYNPGEDLLLRDNNNMPVDCVDFKGFKPGDSNHDISGWPMITAGPYGGYSIEKYGSTYDDGPGPDDYFKWYPSKGIKVEQFGTGTYTDENEYIPPEDKGTPGQTNTTYTMPTSNPGEQGWPEVVIDLRDFEDAEGQPYYSLTFTEEGMFQMGFNNTGYFGAVQADGTISGMWTSQIPGFGIMSVTGWFTIGKRVDGGNPTGLDYNLNMQVVDDCGIMGGTNDCSLCNQENGYNCSNCVCAGCSDPEANNYGVWTFGECQVQCVGSGNCNMMFNACSGQISPFAYCTQDSDCDYMGFKCSNSGGQISCGNQNQDIPNPDYFGQCIPEEYGGIGDADCVYTHPNWQQSDDNLQDDEFTTIWDNGSCTYDEPAGYVEGRIIPTGQPYTSGYMLQFRALSEGDYTNTGNQSSYIRKGISGTNFRDSRYRRDTKNGFQTKQVTSGTLGNLVANSRCKMIPGKVPQNNPVMQSGDTVAPPGAEENIREELKILGIQTTLWSTRCFPYHPAYTYVPGHENWYMESDIDVLIPGGRVTEVVHFGMTTDGQSCESLTVTEEWTDVMAIMWRHPTFITRDGDLGQYENCWDGLGDNDGSTLEDWSGCLPHLIVSNEYGEQIEVILQEDSFNRGDEACTTGGGAEPMPDQPIQPR